MKDLETKLKELPQLCIDEKTDDGNMMSSKRLSSQRRQVRPSSAAEEGCASSYDYRPKSGSSSRRPSRSIDNKTGPHRRTATNDAEIKLVNDRDRDHLQHQLKQHRHHHEQQQQRSSTRRRPSAEEQSFSNSIETSSTHPSTSYDDYLIADDEEDYDDHHHDDDGYHGNHGKSCSSTSRSNNSRSSPRRRRRGSRSPSTSRSSSRRSSSNRHHRRHDDYHSSSYSPSRNSSRRLPPRPRRRPSPEDNLRSSFGSSSHDSHRSSRTLPTSSSSYHDKSRDARPPIRRRSSDDLCALESSSSRRSSRYHDHHDRRRRDGCSHRSLSSSSSRRDYSRDNEDHDDPSVNTTVKLRVSSRSSQRGLKDRSNNSRRIIYDEDKTPRKHNHHTTSKNTKNSNKTKNSIDLTIDSNGQGTFTVTSSPSTAPLQFDIQIDEQHSSYLIQTSLGLLHQIRSVHSSKNTNILRTLSHWNSYYEDKEKQSGYCRGQLGIVSMSPSSFTTKHDVVLMTLTGSCQHGSSSSPSSFEDDDVLIKELELFVTDSLWCYLRLHGLVEEEEGRGGDYYLGNNDHDECDQVRNLRAEFNNKNGRKKERVLSRVFKRVIGE